MDKQREPPLFWGLIQAVTMARPGSSCLTQYGGWTASTYTCAETPQGHGLPQEKETGGITASSSSSFLPIIKCCISTFQASPLPFPTPSASALCRPLIAAPTRSSPSIQVYVSSQREQTPLEAFKRVAARTDLASSTKSF